jgi:chromosome partitioning protein
MLPNTIAWHLVKGGSGKSTLSSNHAVSCALSSWKVLAVDLDPQANLAAALGADTDPRWDGGVGLHDAFASLGRHPLPLIKDVRENLDLIASGPEAEAVPQLLQLHASRDPQGWARILDRLLAPYADQYDLILLDLPPTPSLLHTCALTTAHYVVMPVVPQSWSLKGLQAAVALTARLQETSNPDLEMLAVVINQWDARALRRIETFRKELAELVGPLVPVVDTPVRFSQSADAELKDAGRTAVEVEVDLAAQRRDRLSWLKARTGPAPRQWSPSVVQMATDFTAVIRDVNALFAAAQERYRVRPRALPPPVLPVVESLVTPREESSAS